ncbi:unnamed protein product [Brassica oleracea]|uniref:(rape) hypothetical protein n=1 Tax=Brassica napus TaxID=3708 RepID=A0A816IT14_BRANA|nr:unnamed protein product [Brassica napus]CAF1710715.1 unnamed protein product [Brassica napus]
MKHWLTALHFVDVYSTLSHDPGTVKKPLSLKKQQPTRCFDEPKAFADLEKEKSMAPCDSS